MGRILEGKFGDEKKVEKKTAKAIASEGHAMAGREGFGKGKWVGQARSNTPGPWDGRADCLRFASPAEASWRIESVRLGGSG